MKKKRVLLIGLLLILFISGCSSAAKPNNADSAPPKVNTPPDAVPAVSPSLNLPSDISPKDIVKKMTAGINLGNTLEAPHEGDWTKGAKAQSYYFEDFKKAGFTFVRIPVRWDLHTQKTSPYTIDQAWLDRVQQVVDWSMASGLITIVNTHHEDWMMSDYKANADRMDAIWKQISERFRNEPSALLFEVCNEPHINMTLDDVNDLNQRELNIIRAANPTRNVILGGNNYGSLEQLTKIKIPEDNHLIGTFHYYRPTPFTHDKGQTTWGTQEDQQKVRNDFGLVKKWSDQHNIPILVGEFGAQKPVAIDPKVKWLQSITELAKADGFAYSYWDDAGSFRMYNRAERTWDTVLLNAIMKPANTDESKM